MRSLKDNGIGSGVCNIEFADGSKLECSGTNAEFVKTLGILELKSNRGEIVKLKYVLLPIYLGLTSCHVQVCSLYMNHRYG